MILRMDIVGADIYSLKTPKMVLFDYGHTLVAESGYSPLRGAQALMSRVVKNPRGVTAASLNEFSGEVYANFAAAGRNIGLDIHIRNHHRLVFEYLGLEFDSPHEVLELAYWDGAAPGVAMPNIERVLLLLKTQGVMTGVVSNISYSVESLKSRICRLLPYNDFSFYVASSEYMARKPNPLLFEIALRKGGFEDNPHDVWFCGDSPIADVAGASSVGMFPVWFDEKTLDNPFREASPPPRCAHLRVNGWHELSDILEAL